MFAVIRLKGQINLKKEVAYTLRTLRLYKRNTCTLIPSTPEFVGMLNKVQNTITWGEPSQEIITELLKKRGRMPGNKKLTEDYVKTKCGKDFYNFAADLINSKIKLSEVPGIKSFFRLKPPSKGMEVAGLKKPFSLGGSYGYRGKNINDLIKRMI